MISSFIELVMMKVTIFESFNLDFVLYLKLSYLSSKNRLYL